MEEGRRESLKGEEEGALMLPAIGGGMVRWIVLGGRSKERNIVICIINRVNAREIRSMGLI